MSHSENTNRIGRDTEVRHTTVLKCDLVSSTRTKKLLDLDEQLAFQSGFEQIVVDIANRYGAHIDKFEGDGAMIVFDYPLPKEDSAESALRMGLELVRAIGSTEVLPNVRPQLRVGIASGPIAIVKRTSLSMGQIFAGLTIDMAERLRALADPDQVVIADTTKRLAGNYFQYQDLGRVQVKGFEEGVQAWRVVGELFDISRFESQRYDSSRSEIIGRTEALVQLSEACKSSFAGDGQAICLVGEAGIGKSRLAKATLDMAVRLGASILRIDCTPSTRNTPLFPIGMLFRRMAKITSGSSECEKRAFTEQFLAQFLSNDDVSALRYLAPLFGLEGSTIPSATGPAATRNQTISSIVQILKSFAAGHPVALLCEDLHWIDDTTAEVIARVRKEFQQIGGLIIATIRPTSDQVLVDLSTFTNIALAPLDSSMSADLVRAVAKGVTLPDEIISRIVDRCEGVPLVIEEVTRSTIDAASRPDDVVSTMAPIGEVPAPLQLVVQSRLGQWPQFSYIAQSASVLGREFSVQLLEEVLDEHSSSDVIRTIEVFAREGLFENPGTGPRDRAQFKHAMICEAVYNTLLGRDQQRLHSEVADILKCDYRRSSDATPDIIAEHLRKAKRYEEAIHVHLEAAADTAARGAFVESAGHCNAALAILDYLKDPNQRTSLQFQLLIQLGVALTGCHGYAATVVEEVYRRAQTTCGHSAQAELLYPIMRGLATVNLVRGNLPTAYDLSMQSLDLAEKSQRPEFCIDAMSVISYTTLYYGRLSDCCAWIDRCLQLYRSENGECLTYPVPQDAGTAVIALLPTVKWLMGDAEASEKAVQDGLEHVERIDRAFDRALLHSWIAGARYTQRRYAQALSHAKISHSISQEHGYAEWSGTSALLTFLSQAALNADVQAVAGAAAVYAIFEREGVGLNASYYLWGLALGHARIGDVTRAQEMLVEALRRAQASEESRMNAELFILQAELQSNEMAATRLLDSAIALAAEQGAVATELRAAAALVLRTCAEGPTTEYARRTLDMLDGRSEYPPDRNWMHDRLKAMRHWLFT
jgi:class 3 adenylate cyclase